uniref:Uncharacterized protein n=1 Tax=Caenorhabditis japonica TaxID=281687 RepID=A0A8R1ERY4_CAEJA
MRCPGNFEEAGMLFVAMPLILSITGRSRSFCKPLNTHIFQQENAATHIRNSTRDWLALKRVDLKDATKAEWDPITEAELKTLVVNMPNRMIEVIEKFGG